MEAASLDNSATASAFTAGIYSTLVDGGSLSEWNDNGRTDDCGNVSASGVVTDAFVPQHHGVEAEAVVAQFCNDFWDGGGGLVDVWLCLRVQFGDCEPCFLRHPVGGSVSAGCDAYQKKNS